ncbi:MAG: hypothetical protein BWY71_00024 [Planctomycetes bacterium ADurb.Bin412]|nr:MAG: hypothetical protein BWY71_00024 [Planctomycetes bacterium ADurb.Bin412]
MKNKSLKVELVLALVIFLSCCLPVLADRALDREEMLPIIRTLIANQRKTWIAGGSMEATHISYEAPKILDAAEIESKIEPALQAYRNNPDKPEKDAELQKMAYEAIPFNIRYRYGNEYTMTATEIVKYDGTRFYWEINVISRIDSIQPPMTASFMYEFFNLDWNGRRVFVWNGREYTTYSRSVKNAMVAESPVSVPVVVNGPLTAGIIPWGYGFYTYERLASAQLTGTETVREDGREIHLQAVHADGLEMSFVLDPDKNYAVLFSLVARPDYTDTVTTYEKYQLIGGRWVPGVIAIENYNEYGPDARLLKSDRWEMVSIETAVPAAEAFEIQYEQDTYIEYQSAGSPQTLSCLYTKEEYGIDTEALLQEKKRILENTATAHNCGTIALQYSLGRLGIPVSDQEAAGLIDYQGNTSIYAMKQFARSKGLQGKVVKTDIDTLKQLNGYQVILSFPGSSHFVVLTHADEDGFRVVDLAKRRFYYRTDASNLPQEWLDGVALVLSMNAIELPDTAAELGDTEAVNIVGAAFYDCINLLQPYYVIFCLYSCDGLYEDHFERWGCISAPSGSCYGSWLERYKTSECITDPWDPTSCTITGVWKIYYMRACR